MRLTDIHAVTRIAVEPTGKPCGERSHVLQQLARLLGDDPEAAVDPEVIFARLSEREKLQSTGIGDGVAIPHTAVEEVRSQRAALLLCPSGVEFDAIDQMPVHIFFGVIGPKSEASAHLKILAKISRLLRSPETRRRLLESTRPQQAYSLIEEHEVSSIKS
jgi:PTS system nitrogen regulatory IIA component